MTMSEGGKRAVLTGLGVLRGPWDLSPVTANDGQPAFTHLLTHATASTNHTYILYLHRHDDYQECQ